MQKQPLTIDDFYNFCKTQNHFHYKYKESGKKLFFHVPVVFKKRESDDHTLFVDVKVLHTGLNRNKSDLKEKAAKHIMETLAYKPVLANFTDINGERDFTSHDMIITQDNNGEEQIEYIERQVGCFTADKPYMEYDDEYGHDYLYARIAIPKEYTDTADIIERKNGTKCSVELEVYDVSYSAKDKCLNIEDAEATGLTLLGTNPQTGEKVEAGMADAHVSLDSFSENNNSMFTNFSVDTELLNELRKLNENFEVFNSNINNNTNGKEVKPMNSLEVLMKVFSVTKEDIDFETKGLSDEELETLFVEKFGYDNIPNAGFEKDSKKEDTDDSKKGEENAPAEGEENDNSNEDDNDNSGDDGDADGSETNDSGINTDGNTYSLILPDGTKKEFSLSLDDIQMALTNLVNDTYAELDNTYYFVSTYPDDKVVVMQDMFTGKSYRQGFSRRKDVFSLEAERVEVHSVWMSADEEKAFNNMKSNYSSAVEELAQFKAEPEKIELLESEVYSMISETDEFKEIAKTENHFSISKDELEKKLDEILLSYAKNQKFDFSNNERNKEPEKKITRKRFSVGGKRGGYSRYGGLKFNK